MPVRVADTLNITGPETFLYSCNAGIWWFFGANISKEYIWLVLGAMLPFWREYALGIQGKSQVFLNFVFG